MPDAESDTIAVNGAGLHYTEAGTGEPVVLVHGSLGDLRSWIFQIEPFAEHFRVVAYSRRNHYPNLWHGEETDYPAASHIADLAALIDRLGLAPAHIVASSYGAHLALALAHRHPQLVRTLVLGEPPLLPWLDRIPEGAGMFQGFLASVIEPARRAFEAGGLEEGVRTFSNAVAGTAMFDQMPPPDRQSMLDNALELRAEVATLSSVPDRCFAPITREDLPSIHIPTLLLNGELSPRMFWLITNELERHLPHTERATIPNASHSMHSMNPQAYNETVLDFLIRHRAGINHTGGA